MCCGWIIVLQSSGVVEKCAGYWYAQGTDKPRYIVYLVTCLNFVGPFFFSPGAIIYKGINIVERVSDEVWVIGAAVPSGGEEKNLQPLQSHQAAGQIYRFLASGVRHQIRNTLRDTSHLQSLSSISQKP
jgi:hypothetical protein